MPSSGTSKPTASNSCKKKDSNPSKGQQKQPKSGSKKQKLPVSLQDIFEDDEVETVDNPATVDDSDSLELLTHTEPTTKSKKTGNIPKFYKVLKDMRREC